MTEDPCFFFSPYGGYCKSGGYWNATATCADGSTLGPQASCRDHLTYFTGPKSDTIIKIELEPNR